MKATKAFTLIELLVVIAIIAILAAILFPVFAQAKAAAKKAVAVSDQKQIALGMIMYENDYDDTLPMAQSYGAFNTNLPIELSSYIQKVANNYMGESGSNNGSNVWHDPMDIAASQTKQSFVPIFWTSGSGRQAWDTYLAGVDANSGYIPGRSSSEFLAPADTFVLAETANDQSILGHNFPGVKRPWDPVTSTWSGQPSFSSSGAYFGQDCKTSNSSGVCTALMNPAKPSGFHNGDSWVYAYADGHAKALKVMATIGKGHSGGVDNSGAACTGLRPCGPWTLDDQD